MGFLTTLAQSDSGEMIGGLIGIVLFLVYIGLIVAVIAGG